jgi:glucokinase
MAHIVLAADIGGTSTRAAVLRVEGDAARVLRETSWPSLPAEPPAALLARFLAEGAEEVEGACVAVAAPVQGETCRGPNLPWPVRGPELRRRLSLGRVRLVNDLAAAARGIPALGRRDTVTLHRGRPDPAGNIAVIAAGTGLGMAVLVRRPDGGFHVLPTEGGHADFGPRGEEQIALLRWLARRLGHVSVERVLSGPGLREIFEFLCEAEKCEVPARLRQEMASGDPSAAVSRAGLSGEDTLAAVALDLFVAVYGAEAGNLALRSTATAGVFLAGGIAPRILPRLTEGPFMESFLDKGRFRGWVSRVPVRVVTSPHLALLGAAFYAAERLGGSA